MRDWMVLVVASRRYGYSENSLEIAIPVNPEEGD